MSACGFVNNNNSSSASSQIYVEIFPQSPRIFLSPKQNAICRKNWPAEDIYDLDIDEGEGTASDTGRTEDDEQEGDSNGDDNNSQQPQTSANTNKINVSANWFEIGLSIANNAPFHLLIDRIAFNIKAQWGSDVLSTSKAFSSDYPCAASNEAESSLPEALYIIPPKQKAQYKKNAKNYINNITLYVDGLSIPTGPPSSTRSDPVAPENIENSINNLEDDTFVLDRLPSYRVNMIIYGRFINEKGDEEASLSPKKISFYTPSNSFIQ